MLTAAPVIRSAGARALFLTTAAVTVAIYLWTDHVSRNVLDYYLAPVFRMLFMYYDGQAAGGLAFILILAALFARPGWLNRVACWVSDHTLAIAAGTAVLLSVGSLAVYGHDPFTMDEFVPLLQGQAFAAGHLTTRYPPDLIDWMIPASFQHHFLEFSPTTGEGGSTYWPSFALLLVPFIWLGIPWACNAVVSGLTLLVVRRLALELFEDREAAGFAVLLTIASPVVFGAGISYYSEPAHLLTNAVYALLLLRPSARNALAAGLVGSIALTLHNPFPHFVFALPWLAWVATRPQGIRLLAWLAAGYLPLTLLLGLGWPMFVHGLPHGGFGPLITHNTRSVPDPGDPPILMLIPQLGVLYVRLIGFAKIWLWAVPGLVVLAYAGARQTRDDPRCRLLAASAVTTFVGYLFVGYDQGHGWGFRYFHGAWFVLPLLAAAALTGSRPVKSPSAGFATDEVRAFVTACALLTLVLGVGQRALQIDRFVSAEVSQGPHYHAEDGSVVMYSNNGISRYGNVLVHNDPWLRDKVFNLVSHGSKADAALLHSRFPGLRRIYYDPWGSVWSDKPQEPAAAHR